MGDKSEQASALDTVIINHNKLGMDNLSSENFDEALQHLHEANLLIQQTPNSKLRAMTLNNLGCLYKRLKQYGKAVTFLSEAEKEESSDSNSKAATQLNLCAVRSMMNQHKAALAHARKALSFLRGNVYTKNTVITAVIAYNNAANELEFLGEPLEASLMYYEGWQFAVEHLGRAHDMAVHLLSACKQAAPKNDNRKNLSFMTPDSFKAKADYKISLKPRLRPKQKKSNLSLHTDFDSSSSRMSGKQARNTQRAFFKLSPIDFHKKLDNMGEQLGSLNRRIGEFESTFFRSDTPSKLSFFSKKRQNAARTIQQSWKSYKAGKNLNVSAVLIQKYLKGRRDRRMYRKLKKAVIVLQVFFRQTIARDTVSIELSVVRIQSFYRYWVSYKGTKKRRHSLSIAAWFKTKIIKRKVRRDLICQKIQKHFKTCLFMDSKRKLITGIVNFQAYVRMINAKNYLKHLKEYYAALFVQKMYRGWKGREYSKSVQESIKEKSTLIQKALRRLIGKEQHEDYQKTLILSQKMIEKWYRGWKDRKTFKEYKTTVNMASAVISIKFKQFIEIMKVRSIRRYNELINDSSIIVQQKFRQFLDHRNKQEYLDKMSLNSILIQTKFREYTARIDMMFKKTQENAIKTIQIKLKELFDKELVNVLKEDIKREHLYVIHIQTALRGLLAKEKCENLLKVTSDLKRYVQYLCTKLKILSLENGRFKNEDISDKEKQEEFNSSLPNKDNIDEPIEDENIPENLVTIQTYFRYFLAMNTISGLKKNSKLATDEVSNYLIIQRAFRSFIANHIVNSERNTKELLTNRCLIVQKSFRRYMIKMEILNTKPTHQIIEVSEINDDEDLEEKKSEISIENTNSLIDIKKEENYNETTEQNPEVPIQVISSKSQFRHEEEKSHHNCCISIQKAFRSYLLKDCKKIQRIKANHSARIIQRSFYHYKERCNKKIDKNYNVIRSVCLLWLASQFKKDLVLQKSNEKLNRFIIPIQSLYKKFLSKNHYNLLRYSKNIAAVMIQKHFKSYFARNQYLKMRKAALVIQSVYRSRRAKSEYKILQSFLGTVPEAFNISYIPEPPVFPKPIHRSLDTRLKIHKENEKRKELQRLKRIRREQERINMRREEQNKLKQIKLSPIQKQTSKNYEILQIEEIDENSLTLNTVNYVQLFLLSAIAKVRYEFLKSVIKAQSNVRGFLQRQKTLKLKKATVVLQKRVRKYFKHKTDRRKTKIEFIQAWVKGYKQRKAFYRHMHGIINFQCLVKQFLATNYIRNYRSQNFIPSALKTLLTMKDVKARIAMSRIVREYKVFSAKIVCMNHFKSRTIQVVFRAFMAQFRVPQVVVNGRTFKSGNNVKDEIPQEQKISRNKPKVKVLKRFKEISKQSDLRERAVAKIRAFYKGRLVRNMYLRVREAAIVIQKNYRARRVRQIYIQFRGVVCFIQCYWRMYQHRKNKPAKVVVPAKKGFFRNLFKKARKNN